MCLCCYPAVIRVELPANDAHKDMKQRFLGGAKYSRREFQIPGRSYREKKTKELFSFMRLIKAKDSELMLLSSGDGFKVRTGRNFILILFFPYFFYVPFFSIQKRMANTYLSWKRSSPSASATKLQCWKASRRRA